MFTCNFTNEFKRDYKRALKRRKKMNLFESVYDHLAKSGSLPPKYKPHPLKGKWIGNIDAHIGPDWILIYRIDTEKKEVWFIRMGSHSDLF